MKLKKNIDKDLNLKRGLYFAVGLLFVLALIYLALEWKTLNDNEGYEITASPKKEYTTEDSTVILETEASSQKIDLK